MFPFCPWGFFRKVANYGFELSYVFLLAFFLKTEFPTYFEKGIINVSYNIIFYYSKAELAFLKCKKKIVKYTKELLDNSSVVFFLFKTVKSYKKYFFKRVKRMNKIQFIKDNNIVFETTKDTFLLALSGAELLREKPDFDFIIFSDYSAKSDAVPKLVFYSVPSKEQLNYELASTKSIMTCKITFSGYEYLYNFFKPHDYNYFVVGNVFNNVFIEYFVKTHSLQTGLTKHDFNQSTIEIIDQDVNIIKVRNSEKIIIQKDNITVES